MRVRKDVGKLTPGDATLLWYGRAIAAMQQKLLADPTSWRYQAAIHDYISGQDPLAQAGDVFPADADTYWAQCQHSTWYFLPWHRMYLHHFEEIVAAQVAALGGPADWALPYWNYSEGGSSSLLPPAFRSPTLADGSPNELYVAQRDDACNAGQTFMRAQDVDLRGALVDPRFDAVGQAGASSFGGPVTQFEHSGGSVTGALEMTPHGNIHMAVAGDGGWMGAFNTAALDPIFWLHHCNLDRLWAVWLAMPNSGHANPPDPSWLTSVAFPFHDASGGAVSMTPAQVLDTTALGYAYDDTSDPLPAAGRPFTRVAGVPAPAQPAEMVGATSQSFDLAGTTTHATVPVVTARAAARVARVAQPVGPRRVFVDVENLTAKTRPGSYDVYLGVPVGDDPAAHPDRLVGTLPMFGVVEASRSTTKHAGSGMHYALDATELYERLAALPGFDPSQLRVSFVPARAKAGGTVHVGRVSLYFE
jgi:tyrosinase